MKAYFYLIPLLLALASCGGSGSSGPSSGSGTTPAADDNAPGVISATTPNSEIAASVNNKLIVPINFITKTGEATQLKVDLRQLPNDWSVLDTTKVVSAKKLNADFSSFECTKVGNDSSCLLTLQYTPTNVVSGELKLPYTYSDASQIKREHTYSLKYSASVDNNLVIKSEPILNASLNKLAPLVISFASSDIGTIKDLTADALDLPAGWNYIFKEDFSCKYVYEDGGCNLYLFYTPTELNQKGTLKFNFKYISSSDTPKIATINIPYSSMSDNDVSVDYPKLVATTLGNKVSVPIQFFSSDGEISDLNLDLSSLPNGFTSSTNSLTCSKVSLNYECKTSLIFDPTQIQTKSLLVLNYSYKTAAGLQKAAKLSIEYLATSNNKLVVTTNPASPLKAIAGNSYDVEFKFNSDDGNSFNDLTINNLNTLNSDWSIAKDLQCETLNNHPSCSLILRYTPSASVLDSYLSLNYSYKSNSGQERVASFLYQYLAGTRNDLVAPSQLAVNYVVGDNPTTLKIDLKANAGELTNFNLNYALPNGFTETSNTCKTMSSLNTTGCSISLAYTSSAEASGNFNINLAYTNSVGEANQKTIPITYQANSTNSLIITATSNSLSYILGGAASSLDLSLKSNNGELTQLTLPSNLPVGMSVSQNTCGSRVTTSSCTVTLSYSGTSTHNAQNLDLVFNYIDKNSRVKTSQAQISYQIIPGTIPKIITYYENSATYGTKDYQATDIPASDLDEIMYAFAQVGDCDGQGVSNFATDSNPTLCNKKASGSPEVVWFSGVQDYKLHSNDWFSDFYVQQDTYKYGKANIANALGLGKPVLISLGGYTLSVPIRTAIVDAHRALFIQSIIDFMTVAYNDALLCYNERATNQNKCPNTPQKFAGVDVDWEPNTNGWTLDWGSTGRLNRQDLVNYLAFMTNLRTAINKAYTQGQLSNKLLTSAITAPTSTLSDVDKVYGGTISYWKLLADQLDSINLMSYDYHGAWDITGGIPYVNFNAPLYFDDRQPVAFGQNRYFTVENSLNYLINTAKIPANKVVIGVPAYGRAYKLDPNYLSSSAPYYPAIAGGFSAADGAIENYIFFNRVMLLGVNAAGTPVNYNFSSSIIEDLATLQAYAITSYNGVPAWVSLDTYNTAKKKMQYAKSRGLYGVMVWEAATDVRPSDSGYATKSVIKGLKDGQ